MKFKLLLSLLCGISMASWSAQAAESGNYDVPKDQLHVYLLMGGAEMAGRVEVADVADKVIERCYLLNPKGDWEPAKASLNRYSTLGGDLAKLGPGVGFALQMLEKNPDISIGLVGCAAPDSRIEDWHMKSPEYRQARKLAKVAAKTGRLRGVIWQHRASHSILPLNELKTTLAYLRSDMDLLNLPVVVGEVQGDDAMNVQMAELAKTTHATSVASLKGVMIDDAKLDAPGVLLQGAHFAEEMMRLHTFWDKRGDRKPPTDIAIIDPHIHAHANKPNGLDALAKWMERNNVGQAIVSPIGDTRASTPEQRKIMLSNYDKYRGKIHRFCLIEPGEVRTVGEAVKILEKEKREGAVAFGEHYGRSLMFDDPKNLLLYEACQKAGLPVMFHIDQNKNMDELGLPRVERVLKAYPECKLVAHAWWWLHFAEGTCDRQMRDHPNLYADISGVRMAAMLNRDRAYSREFLIRHQDRILFGSDAGWWSFNEDPAKQAQFRILEELDLPEEVRRKIYRENAIKLFGIEKSR